MLRRPRVAPGPRGGVEVSSCSGTPSGSITGIDNGTLTGIISTQHVYGILGVNSVDNATDCIDNATSIAAFNASTTGAPTGTNSMIMNQAITSSSTFANRIYFYSDSSCQTEIATVIMGNSEFTVGDRGSTSTAISGKSGTYPSTATKVTYKRTCFGLKGSTDAGVTWLKTFFGDNPGIDPTVGTSYSCQNDGDLESALIQVDNSSNTATVYSTNFVYWDDAATDNWTSGVDSMTTLP